MASLVSSILGAVSGTTQVVRRAPGPGHSDMARAVIGGPVHRVSAITQAAARQSVEAAHLTPGLEIVHAGVMYRASDVVTEPPAYFLDLLDAMLDRARALTGSEAEAMTLVFGSDLRKASQVSLPERMMRFAKGQKTGLAELRARNLNPAVVLNRAEALDALTGLCRGYITRLDEAGLRLEFAWGVEAEQFRVPGRLGFLYQMRTPTLRGTQLASATDALILDVLARQAFAVQLKAYRNVADLLFGRLALRSVTGRLRYASGPAIPQQIVTDFCRYLPWGNKVPGEGMDLPRTVFPETSGWYPLRPTVVFVIDDLYLRNKVFMLISEAFHRTGKKTLDILTDINASPADKDQLIDMFPDGIVRGQFRSPLDIQDDFDDWLITLLSREEALLNEYLRTTLIHDLLGRYVTVRLVRATDGVGTALNVVGVAP